MICVEQLAASMMEICQNGLNQPEFPIHFVLGILGACNKRRNNPQSVIDTSPDLERAVNND